MAVEVTVGLELTVNVFVPETDFDTDIDFDTVEDDVELLEFFADAEKVAEEDLVALEVIEGEPDTVNTILFDIAGEFEDVLEVLMDFVELEEGDTVSVKATENVCKKLGIGVLVVKPEGVYIFVIFALTVGLYDRVEVEVGKTGASSRSYTRLGIETVSPIFNKRYSNMNLILSIYRAVHS